MKIGIMGAMEEEVSSILKLMSNTQKKVIGGSMRSLGIPMTFLFDRQGKIHAKHIGVPRGADPYWILKEDLKRLL